MTRRGRHAPEKCSSHSVINPESGYVRCEGSWVLRTTAGASCRMPHYGMHSSAPNLHPSPSPNALKHLNHKKVYMPGSISAKVRKIQSQENNIFLQEPEQLENVSSQTFKMRPLSLINYKINILGLDFFLITKIQLEPWKEKKCFSLPHRNHPEPPRFYHRQNDSIRTQIVSGAN